MTLLAFLFWLNWLTLILSWKSLTLICESNQQSWVLAKWSGLVLSDKQHQTRDFTGCPGASVRSPEFSKCASLMFTVLNISKLQSYQNNQHATRALSHTLDISMVLSIQVALSVILDRSADLCNLPYFFFISHIWHAYVMTNNQLGFGQNQVKNPDPVQLPRKCFKSQQVPHLADSCASLRVLRGCPQKYLPLKNSVVQFDSDQKPNIARR